MTSHVIELTLRTGICAKKNSVADSSSNKSSSERFYDQMKNSKHIVVSTRCDFQITI
jgi:hypothetical protein